ncbi:BIG/ATPase V1 complex, subunit S1 [Dendryphion nanum]|uniref:Protein BIG1 n=1 Tax=Dendryphion nanum TaxID=256645 RepID=A0A9P9IWJ1_9PLEO|nr:BIG/ATPase V1 complex, subunit S1 [Dendryphion nanum]
MAKVFVGAALAIATLPSTLAFRNTSPFLLLSTADLSISGKNLQISQSSAITNQLADVLSACPTERYIVVQQEGVSSADYEAGLGSRFDASLHDKGIKSSIEVAQVVGTISIDDISSQIQKACGAKVERLQQPRLGQPVQFEPLDLQGPLVVELLLQPPGKGDRSTAMHAQNSWVSDAIDQRTSGDFTVIYTTTPRTDAEALPHPYEMETPFKDAVHMELKRDVSAHSRDRKAANGTDSEAAGGLFETYQFLNPGLFMGLSAAVPLILILIGGLKALSGLEVSYFAFSKEMGPAAQRK